MPAERKQRQELAVEARNKSSSTFDSNFELIDGLVWLFPSVYQHIFRVAFAVFRNSTSLIDPMY